MKRCLLKNGVLLVISVFFIMCFMTSCGKSTEELLCQSWYSESNIKSSSSSSSTKPTFTFYSDGTCQTQGLGFDSYVSTKWSVVNDNQLKISDNYGTIKVFTIKDVKETKLTLEKELSENQTKEYIFYNSVDALDK